MNIIELFERFKNQEDCINYLERVRWNKEKECPYCKCNKASKGIGRYWVCLGCGNSYSVTVNTIFHDSKVELKKWFAAIFLILNAKKGISGLQLQRDLGIGSYQTAWRMLRLIRRAMVDENMRKYFQEIIEMDETYIGGKPPKFKKDNKRGRGTSKQPVVGVMDRLEKKVYCRVANKNEEGKQLSGKQLLDVLEQVGTKKKDLWVMTDEFRSYNLLKKSGWNHGVIDHSVEFVNGDVHTNTIESFWAILKRGIYGIYHNISAKYMQQYINEFCFRYNNRDESAAFDLVIKKALLIKSC